jgi:hypothetical protein
MTAPFVIIEGVLASTVADDGTVTLSYPSGYSSSDTWGTAHVLVFNDNDVFEAGAETFSLTFSTDITLTNLSGASWAAGTRYRVQADLVDTAAPEGQKQAAITNLGGTLTGTTDGNLADVGATNGSDVSGAINTNFKEIQVKFNLVLAALREYGMIAS